MPRTRSAGLRDHLVAATDELLDSATPAGLTTRHIAKHAAVSDGVLYNHFGDKQDLLVAALVRRYSRLVEGFERRLEDASMGEETTWQTWIRGCTRALRDLNADALHLAAGLLADPALLQRVWVEIHRVPLGLDRLRGPLLERLRAAQAAGEIGAHADVDAAVTTLFGLAVMGAVTIRVNAHVDRALADRDLDAGVSIVLAGLESP